MPPLREESSCSVEVLKGDDFGGYSNAVGLVSKSETPVDQSTEPHSSVLQVGVE